MYILRNPRWEKMEFIFIVRAIDSLNRMFWLCSSIRKWFGTEYPNTPPAYVEPTKKIGVV